MVRRALARECIAWIEAFRELYPRHDPREYLAAWVAGFSPERAGELAEAELRELVVAMYADAPHRPRRVRRSACEPALLTRADQVELDRQLECSA